MKKFYTAAISCLLLACFFLPQTVDAKVVSPPIVKKSANGLCHGKNTKYYNQTKKFKAYKTLTDCLKSGGKMPKK